ncbi:hypothetical protein BDQ17DRAFT_1365807 [Cyathus striatus]|nr:hypothetical protein BDQ17DRAFT_1365807 [Cyathus striatus]
MSMTRTHLSRCQDLVIDLEVLKSAFKVPRKRPILSNIRKLTLDRSGKLPSYIFQGVVVLQELDLCCVTICDTDFPFTRLKKLSFRGCRLQCPQSGICTILKGTPNLEKLVWICSGPIPWDWEPDPPNIQNKAITLPLLHTLQFAERCPARENILLPIIHAPSLSKLQLIGKIVYSLIDFCNFAKRSCFQIKSLKLAASPLSDLVELRNNHFCQVEELYLDSTVKLVLSHTRNSP